MNQDRLSLSEALRTNRLDEFIAQEELRGVGPADVSHLEETLAIAAKWQLSEDQTSHSSSGDCSTEK